MRFAQQIFFEPEGVQPMQLRLGIFFLTARAKPAGPLQSADQRDLSRASRAKYTELGE